MAWVWVVLAGLLGVVAAVVLARRGYRRPDDERHLVVRPWSVPVLAVLGAVTSADGSVQAKWMYSALSLWTMTQSGRRRAMAWLATPFLWERNEASDERGHTALTD